MRGLLILLIAAAAVLGRASLGGVLYDRSNVRTGIGNGAHGADTSSIAPNASYPGYPFTQPLTPPVWAAEQFTLSSLSLVNSVVVLADSTWPSYGFPPNSPFFGATMNIWEGQPGAAGSTIVANSNLLADSRWTGVYRVDPITPRQRASSYHESYSRVQQYCANRRVLLRRMEHHAADSWRNCLRGGMSTGNEPGRYDAKGNRDANVGRHTVDRDS